MGITRDENTGEPIVTFTRHEAIVYIVSALHNFTVDRAGEIARHSGMNLASAVAIAAAIKDRGALVALGVDPMELELAAGDMVHAH